VFYEANKYSVHAEQSCISKCKNKKILKKCKMILVCLDGDGGLRECKSCEMCRRIIDKYGVKRVVSYFN